MNPTDRMPAKKEANKRQSAGAVAGSDGVLRNFEARLRAFNDGLQRTSDQRKSVNDLPSSDVKFQRDDLPPPSPRRKFEDDGQNPLSQISHHHDDETSERTTISHPFQAIENQTKKRGSRGFAGYPVAICIGVAATLAWQSYGDAAKQKIASLLGWSIAASVTQTETLAPKAPTALSLDPVQVQQMVQGLASLRESVQQLAARQESLAALTQTVDKLAAGQDQMVHQIDMLQSANQEILDKIPASSRQLPAAPARKPKPAPALSSRAPIPSPSSGEPIPSPSSGEPIPPAPIPLQATPDQ